MPKEIKTKKAVSAKPQINKDVKINSIKPVEKDGRQYYCSCCGKPYDKQKDNFPHTVSPLFKGNNNYSTICKNCTPKLYTQFVDFFSGNEEKAIERLCQLNDWYFGENPLNSSKKISADRLRINGYVSKLNISPNTGKTYSETLIERSSETVETFEDMKDKGSKVQQKTVKFFGLGFSEEEYQQMANQYDDWIGRHECKTKAQEELFKNICIIQVQIQKATQRNEKVDGLMKTYQDLLGSANLKPVQTSENTIADQNTFGTLIKKWEDELPISEPDPKWKDVDGIRKYVNVWFLGHLCKMMGIKNSYSQEYEDEIAKYKVEKPEYFDEDENDDPELDDMFNEGM